MGAKQLIRQESRAMISRLFIIISTLAVLSACTTQQPQPKPMAEAPMIPQPKPELDVITALNTPSVTVYSLKGNEQNPFSNKQLQPLSQKVIGEGYPVLDPSVIVYPLNPPTSIPNVAFDNIRTGADSSLYSARVRAMAAQRPMERESLPVIGAGQTSIEATPLPPIIDAPINVPSLPATPAEPLFTPVGKRVGPVAERAAALPPAVIPIQNAPIFAPAPQKMQPIIDDAPVPLPIADAPVVTELPMSEGESDTQPDDTIPLPPIPSLTGY